MWNYSKKMLDYFYNPRNHGEMKNPTVVAEVGSLACGDALKIFLKIGDDGKIKDATFQTFGCGSAIASSSALTEMVKGMDVDEALKLTNEDIADFLDGLPPEKMHCSVMGKEALEKAIAIYRGEKLPEDKEEGEIICHCFGVTDEKIKKVAQENQLKSVEEITNYTKAGGGCGCCIPKIEDILTDLWGSVRKSSASKANTTEKNPATTRPKMTIIKKIQKINEILENDIRPSLQSDGGDVELVDVDGNKVLVTLLGVCSGCKASGHTIKDFIQKRLREMIDDSLIVEEV